MMRKIRIIGVILLVCVICISGCQDEKSTKSQKRDRTSGLILNEKEIQREMKYLNSQYLKIYSGEKSSIYFVEFLNRGSVWYVKRDEQKAYTYNKSNDVWPVRIGEKGYWVSSKTVFLEADANEIKEMEQGLDNLFHFYAMINIRDNTPRIYKRGDKGFEELAMYYSRVEEIGKNEITFFKIKRGKTKKSTYMYVGYRRYEESDGENRSYDYISTDQNISEVVFDIDQEVFDTTYEELKHLVKILPKAKNKSMEEKE